MANLNIGNSTANVKVTLNQNGDVHFRNGTLDFDSSSLPEFNGTPSYLVGIESFVNGGILKWASKSNISVGSADNADKVDNYHANALTKSLVWSSGADLNTIAQTQTSALGMIHSNTGAPNVTNTDPWWHYIQINYNNSSGGGDNKSNFWTTQIANIPGSTDLYVRSHRAGNDTSSGWAGWHKILTENNFNNHALRKISSSTDNAIARWDGADGKSIQNSGILIDDNNNLLMGSGRNIYFNNTASGARITNNGTSSIDLLNGSSAIGLNVGNVCISNVYSDRSKVPTDGLYVKGTSYLNNKLIIEGTSEGPYLTVNYGSRYDSNKSLDNYGINLIKFGMSSMDNYLGTSLNGKTFSGKYAYTFHTATGYSFGWFTSGWIPVMELECNTGNLRTKGNIYLGGTTSAYINSTNYTGNAATASKLKTARNIALSGNLQGSTSFDGSGDVTITALNYQSRIYGGNTYNYPWHRIATATMGTSQYRDQSVLLRIRHTFNGGGEGLVKISVRTNSIGSQCDISAIWLYRYNISINHIGIGLWGVTGDNVYLDVYYKCAYGWPRGIVESISNGRIFTLISSNEASDTTTTDKKTSTEVYTSIENGAALIHGKAYTKIVYGVDGTDNNRYVLKSGDTMTGSLTAPSVYTSNWFRSTGSTGWYSESYGGGWYMTDSTYIRNYGSKTTRLDNLCLGADNNSYRLYINGTSYQSDIARFAKTGTAAIFGGTAINIDPAIYAPTSGIQLCASNGGTTNSTAIGFHNPGFSSAVFGYYQIDANNGQFRMRSEDTYWDLSLGGTIKLTSPWGKANLVVGENNSDKIVAGYLVGNTNGAVIGAHNSALTAWAPVNLSGSIINFREGETVRGKILDGCLSLFPSNSNFREGIRIHTTGSWSDILLCGNDNTGDSGTSANSWFLGNNNGNFYITRNGSTSSTASYASVVNNYWQFYPKLGINGTNTSYNLYVNGTSYFNGNTTHNGIDYFANSTSFYIDNSADANLRRGLFAGTSNSDTAASEFFRTGALEIRESGRVSTAQSSFNYAPRIGFHWSGRIAATLSFHSDGNFYLRKQNGSDRATLDANLNGNAATATNADKIDDYHLSEGGVPYKYINTINQPTANTVWYLKISTSDWNGDNEIIKVYARGNNRSAKIIIYSGSRQTNWHAYATQYNGTCCNGIKKVISSCDNVYIRLDSGTTSVVIYTTFNPTITTTTDTDGYTNIPTEGGLFGNNTTFDKVYGAVWNDYAEYRETHHEIEPGRCVIEVGDGSLTLAFGRLQPGANIVSDTFGFAIGATEINKTPLAVSGRVLAYPNESRESYHPGDPVCSGPNGTISLMTREEVREWPDRIVGTVSEIPNYETWGTGNVEVNGRIWIKVK